MCLLRALRVSVELFSPTIHLPNLARARFGSSSPCAVVDVVGRGSKLRWNTFGSGRRSTALTSTAKRDDVVCLQSLADISP